MTKRPIVSKDSLDLQSNHFLRRKPAYPLGISLGELDYLRGWKDDFLGDVLADQYTSTLTGAGSTIALVDGAHGGWVRLTSGPANTRQARLWLGDGADGYDTLDADEGFVIITRVKLNDLANASYDVAGTSNSAITRYIFVKYDSTVFGGNWYLASQDGVAATTQDSGVAADTDPHWHKLEVTTDYMRHSLDGALINTKTTNIPTEVLTAILRSYSRAAATRSMDVDVWNAIPRNL